MITGNYGKLRSTAPFIKPEELSSTFERAQKSAQRICGSCESEEATLPGPMDSSEEMRNVLLAIQR